MGSSQSLLPAGPMRVEMYAGRRCAVYSDGSVWRPSIQVKYRFTHDGAVRVLPTSLDEVAYMHKLYPEDPASVYCTYKRDPSPEERATFDKDFDSKWRELQSET